MSRGYTPRCCEVCGGVLEDWPRPMPDESYTACLDCGIPYQLVNDRLERRSWAWLAPELSAAIEEVMQSHWSARSTVAAAFVR